MKRLRKTGKVLSSDEIEGTIRDHIQVPLSKMERLRIVREITESRLKPSQVSNVERLVRIVELALNPGTGRGWDAAPDCDKELERRQQEAAITKEIGKIRRAAKRLDALIEPYGAPPPYSLVAWVNPFSDAIVSVFAGLRLREQANLASVLKRLSTACAAPLPATGKVGRPRIQEPAKQLVRAVCYFMAAEGLTIQYTWPPAPVYPQTAATGRIFRAVCVGFSGGAALRQCWTYEAARKFPKKRMLIRRVANVINAWKADIPCGTCVDSRQQELAGARIRACGT